MVLSRPTEAAAISPQIELSTDKSPSSLTSLISILGMNPFGQQAIVASLRPLDLTALIAGAAAAGCLMTGSIAMILVKNM